MAFVALAIVSACVLLAEIAFTRYFSFRLWYHYAFMIISVALLGLGSASAAMELSKARWARFGDHVILATATLLFSIALTGSTWLLGALGGSWLGDPRLGLVGSFVFLGFVWLLLLIPFFFAGCAISWSVRLFSPRIATAYAYDLVGAGVGALGAGLLLRILQPEQALGVVAGAAAIAALLFHASGSRFSWRMLAGSALAVLAAGPLIVAGGRQLGWITPTKGLAHDLALGGRVLATLPNTNGRVDVVADSLGRFAWGLGGSYHGPFPEQLAIRIDGDAMTAITRFDGNASSWQFADFMPASLPYAIASPRRVLVIGPGGGMDVVNSLNRGVDRVVGVEINEKVIEAVQERFADFAGGVYMDPRVAIVHSDGRNYVQRTTEHFDLIQLTLVDTFAAISSGALSLSEDFLYTTEAFRAYVAALTADGMLALGRTVPEALPLVALLDSATRAPGFDLSRHLLLVDNPEQLHSLVLLFKNAPLTDGELRAGMDFVQRAGLHLVYAPGLESTSDPAIVQFLASADRDRFVESWKGDIAPESDDRPFYFRSSKWSDLLGTYVGGLGNLWIILAIAIFFGIACIVVPLSAVARRPLRRDAAVLAYFVCLGLGFIFVELAMMTKLVLFLGHPVRSLTVTLLTLLVFTGLGSAASRRIPVAKALSGFRSGAGVPRLLAGLSVLVLVYSWALTPTLERWMGLPLPVRMVAAGLLIAPLGLLLGAPLPSGIRLLDGSDRGLILWAWGSNALASVVGSVGCILLAHAVGFDRTFRAAAALYLLALLLWLKVRVRLASPDGVGPANAPY